MSQQQKENEQTQDQGMSFWDHLDVLRKYLFHILGFFVVALVGTFIAMPYIFDTVILAPTTSDFFIYRWVEGAISFDNDFHVNIININVASQFTTHIETAVYLSFIITFPFIVYEIWRFIRPALYDNEVRHIRPAFVGGTIMFYIGCAVGYFIVFPFTFRFLIEYELSPQIDNQINLSSYIGNFSMLILIMGVVFEMPLLAWLLSQLGLVNKQLLRKYRRHAIVALLILAAIITPSGDPFTLSLVFTPLYILYEISILVVKKKKVEEEIED